MKALKTHVAGVDAHKDILAITILIGDADKEPEVEHLECSTMTDDLRACGLLTLSHVNTIIQKLNLPYKIELLAIQMLPISKK